MKYVLFSDIHFGNKNSSDIFNNECLEFLNFMDNWCSNNILEPFETIFMGDWFHTRNAVNVKTLNYGKEGLIKLSNIGEKQYLILGNHDLYYLDKREVSSVIVPEEAQGIEIIDSPLKLNDDILLCPWLVGEETLKDIITEYNPKYVFGHFELPSFKLNSKMVMEGEFNPFDYVGPKKIFSGHYHTFDEKANITYIGACFSHNFSDVNDWHNKGFVVFDTNTGEYQRVEWKKAPKYYSSLLSQFNPPEDLDNAYVQIINDIKAPNSDIMKLTSALKETGKYKEIQIIPVELDITGEEDSIELKDIGNMNIIIPEMLSKVEMDGIDSNKLIEIYNNLEIQ